MITNVYGIQDTIAGTFNNPFVMMNDGMAKRAFQQLTDDPQSSINKAPGDYKLFKLGTFDDNSGLLTPEKTPKYLATGMLTPTTPNP